ncbi:IclR family transcriptional regulator [Phytoactinopolyspora endophytica]|uniref:IclR family transcriptional regulator n=1 Tax=Phytoactinopolyspora endophytica TaxID=1642495 RepID=UPI00101E1626|nr:IclR family transcriptional regulator [Phytoactinopolyspora endophytica]
MREERGADFVQSLERGLAVIRAFDTDHPQLTLSDVARSTGLTRAAARRFLHTLVELGYVGTDGRLFSLRPRVLELGYAYLSSLSLPELAMPSMERLVERVRESCSMAVLDGDDVVYVARVPTKRIMSVVISVGTRFPAYATSMGRVLLTHQEPSRLDDYLDRVKLDPLTPKTITDREQLRAVLDQVRADGYCLVDEELEEGLRSMAVPVLDGDGRVVAALNVSAHTSRGTASAIRRDLLPPLRETAEAISADIARARHP